MQASARLICPRRIGLRTGTSKYLFVSYEDRIALFQNLRKMSWGRPEETCGQKGLSGQTTSPLHFIKVSVPMQSHSSFTYSISPLQLKISLKSVCHYGLWHCLAKRLLNTLVGKGLNDRYCGYLHSLKTNKHVSVSTEVSAAAEKFLNRMSEMSGKHSTNPSGNQQTTVKLVAVTKKIPPILHK